MNTSNTAFEWGHLFSTRMLAVLFLGFSSGLPLFVMLYLMQAWLAKGGVDIKQLGLFALVGFPYTFKFLWAPFMDRFSLGPLGRRRGWMALTQLALFLIIGGIGTLDPRTQLSLIVLAAGAMTFVSASQDIVIDAYRREILEDAEQGLGDTIQFIR